MKKDDIILSLIELIKNENDGTHIDFVLPGYTQKKFAGYYSMMVDLELCEEAIKKLINDKPDKVTAACLWYTVIALYAKCFTDAAKASFPKLEASEMFKGENEKLRVHKDLMELRHTLVAHRGDTIHEINFVYLKLDIKDSARHVKVKWVKRLRPKEDELNDYLTNVKFLLKAVEKLIFKAADKIWNHMLTKYTPQQLAQLKLAGPKNR